MEIMDELKNTNAICPVLVMLKKHVEGSGETLYTEHVNCLMWADNIELTISYSVTVVSLYLNIR